MAECPGSGTRAADPAALRTGYERLRAAVLSGQPEGFRLGHGVLLTHGLLAWMRAFSSLAPPVPARQAHEPAAAPGAGTLSGSGPPGGALSLPGADQLVAVLAQMTLLHAA
ncbi:MAG: hypothetical protein M0T77_13920 [Actinomycetota bacterium]|nr:hypothetical protein [Actinomycetota bacterium]